ncbi:MAG TPA: lysophospholipid acyltransferase family protein [Methylotenera sp.]|nr:lysophospholipid acyltransferase family protein [Methylotenera sp.]
MPKTLLKIIALLPLPLIHGLGIMIGWISYWTDKKFSRRIRNNLHKSKLASSAKEHARLVRLNVNETGKGILETLAIWVKSQRSILKWVKNCDGWHHVESALATKKGIIFLTPHLGCYEITARYYTAQHPMTVLYTPARKSWLSDIMESGRERSKTTLAPANLSGVRRLFKTLKSGEAVGILPDQVPDLGDGTWATYFDEPAYSMTLVSKLVETTGATVLLAYGERLAWGQGFIIHIEPLNTETSPQDINDAIERLVRKKPEQYLWSYSRFKQPKLSREKRVKINSDTQT